MTFMQVCQDISADLKFFGKYVIIIFMRINVNGLDMANFEEEIQ